MPNESSLSVYVFKQVFINNLNFLPFFQPLLKRGGDCTSNAIISVCNQMKKQNNMCLCVFLYYNINLATKHPEACLSK